jgi:hypothetical protein
MTVVHTFFYPIDTVWFGIMVNVVIALGRKQGKLKEWGKRLKGWENKGEKGMIKG